MAWPMASLPHPLLSLQPCANFQISTGGLIYTALARPVALTLLMPPPAWPAGLIAFPD